MKDLLLFQTLRKNTNSLIKEVLESHQEKISMHPSTLQENESLLISS